MLRQRFITAAILAPLFLAIIGFLPSSFVAIVLGLIVLIGAWELSQLVQLTQKPQQTLYIVLFSLAMAIGYTVITAAVLQPIQLIATISWIGLTVWALLRRRLLPTIAGRRPGMLLIGSLILYIAWITLINIHQTAGPVWLIGLFILIWAVDIGAYFAGRQWGKRQISPQISPGKTWAGALGATAAAILYAIGFGVWQSVPLFSLIVLSCLVTWLSIGGDLAESALKRQAGVKDSGTLLPGHGGILDRIDSLLAAAPAYAVGISLLGLTA